jgi:hypothetical protein
LANTLLIFDFPAIDRVRAVRLQHRSKKGLYSIIPSARARAGSFGQPGFPKALNQHLRT